MKKEEILKMIEENEKVQTREDMINYLKTGILIDKVKKDEDLKKMGEAFNLISSSAKGIGKRLFKSIKDKCSGGE